MSLLTQIFGSRNQRLLKQYQKTVREINALEPAMEKLSDAELQAKTPAFKARIANGETLDAILPEAFAVCREASKRVYKMRHFDVQLIGGMVLHYGAVVQNHAADQLDVEVAHLVDALARLAADRERLRQDGVQRLAVGDAGLEGGRLRLQLGIRQFFHRRFERIDLAYRFLVLLEQPLVAATENLGQ